MNSSPPLWKASVALAKAEAADMASLLELASEPQAVLIAEEPFGPGAVVEALYTEEPDAAILSRLAGRTITVEPLPDQDWIRLSQEGLPPVRAGRFFVYGAHDAGRVPHGVIPIRIEAGLAFGTGHHETTALCLAALSGPGARAARYANVLDLGCGTGLLAIGAAKLWKQPVLAIDIDPVAVEVTRENARINGVAPLVRAVGGRRTDQSACWPHAAPFDLIIANILAGPLTRLAPQIAASLAPGGDAGAVGPAAQSGNMILSFYHGLRFLARHRDGALERAGLGEGSWSALAACLTRRRSREVLPWTRSAPFQTFDDRLRCRHLRPAPGRAARRTDSARAGRFRGAAFRRASGRISARASRTPGLADRLHRLGRRGGGAGGQGGGLRRWPLHACRCAPQTDTKLFEPRDLVAEGPQGWIAKHLPKGAQARLRPLAAHRQRRGGHCATRRNARAARWCACDTNPLDAVWNDQPPPPADKARAACHESGGRDSANPSARASPTT